MADQLRGDAPFSYAVEHYLDTVYRAAFHAAPSPQDATSGSPSTSAKTSTGPSAGRRCP